MSASTIIFSEFKEGTLETEKAIKAVIAAHCENMKEYITNPDRRAKDYGVIANHCENMKEHITNPDPNEEAKNTPCSQPQGLLPSMNIDTGADNLLITLARLVQLLTPAFLDSAALQ